MAEAIAMYLRSKHSNWRQCCFVKTFCHPLVYRGHGIEIVRNVLTIKLPPQQRIAPQWPNWGLLAPKTRTAAAYSSNTVTVGQCEVSCSCYKYKVPVQCGEMKVCKMSLFLFCNSFFVQIAGYCSQCSQTQSGKNFRFRNRNERVNGAEVGMEEKKYDLPSLLNI